MILDKFIRQIIIFFILSILSILSIQLFSIGTNLSTIDNSINSVYMRGMGTSDQIGGLIIGIGDINNDGYDDVLVGDQVNTGAGNHEAHIVLGRSDISNIQNDSKIATVSSVITINADVREAENIGDINGDGFNDLALSFENSYSYNEKDIHIFFGRTTWPKNLDISTMANITIDYFDKEYDGLGISISALGDINNDAFDDFIVSAPGKSSYGSSMGEVYLFYGKNTWESSINNATSVGAVFHGNSTDGFLGYIIDDLGDINNDGYVDIGIIYQDSTASYTSRSYIFFGSISGWNGVYNTSNADIDIKSNFSDANLKSVGDINKDGISDFAMYDQRGIYLWFGRNTWNNVYSMKKDASSVIYTSSNNRFTRPILDGGIDYNDDGISDMEIVGGNGKLYIFLGKVSWSYYNSIDDALVINPTREFILNMNAYKSVGDFDGNGQPDIITGNYRATYNIKGDVGNVLIRLNPNLNLLVSKPIFSPPVFTPDTPSIKINSVLNFTYSEPSNGVNVVLNSTDEFGLAGNYKSNMYVYNETGDYNRSISGFANTPYISSDFGKIKIIRDISGKMVMWNTTDKIVKTDEYFVPASFTWDSIAVTSNYNKNWLAFNSRDMNISIVDFNTKEMVFNWIGPDPNDKIIDISLTDDYLIILSKPRDYFSSLIIIDINTGLMIYNQTSRQEFTQIETLIDGRLILADYYGSLYLFHPNSTDCGIEQLTLGTGKYPLLKANPKNAFVSLYSDYNSVNIFVPDTGEVLEIGLGNSGITSVMDWDSSGRFLSLGYYSNDDYNYYISIWKINFTKPDPRPQCIPITSDTTNSTIPNTDSSITSNTTSINTPISNTTSSNITTSDSKSSKTDKSTTTIPIFYNTSSDISTELTDKNSELSGNLPLSGKFVLIAIIVTGIIYRRKNIKSH